MREVATSEDLLTAMGAVRRALRRHTGYPLGQLTTAQTELLRVVRREPGTSVAAAAERLGVVPNTVSTLVRQLADAGVIERHVDEDDRRVARLELTPDVRRRVDTWRDKRAVALGAALGRLAPQDRRKIDDAVPALSRLAKELERA